MPDASLSYGRGIPFSLDNVRNEADEGRRRGILIPVLLDAVEIPLAFRRIQTANLVDWPGEFDALVGAVSEILSNAAPLEATTRPARVPETTAGALAAQPIESRRNLPRGWRRAGRCAGQWGRESQAARETGGKAPDSGGI